MSSGATGQRAILAPAGHPPVDQRRVLGETRSRPDAEALGHPRPESFDQRIGALHQSKHDLRPLLVLEVDLDRALAATQEVVSRRAGVPTGDCVRRSTLTTSAPRSARTIPQNGAGPRAAISTTLIPCKACPAQPSCGRSGTQPSLTIGRALDEKGAYSKSGVMVKAPSRIALAM